MKAILYSLIGAVSLFITTGVSAAPLRAVLDPATSTVSWIGKKVTGHHEGTVSLKSGEAMLSDGTLTGGKFEIDMSSIVVKDITDEADNKKLTNHLKSEDFFGAELFPATTFTITKVEPITNAAVGEANYTITGDLTIKGITSAVIFPASVTISGNNASAVATVTVDRTKYNVRYGSGRFFENLGNKLIYDEFEVSLDLKAKIVS